MLWVTFVCAREARISAQVGSNMKDENCFAKRTGCGARFRADAVDPSLDRVYGRDGVPLIKRSDLIPNVSAPSVQWAAHRIRDHRGGGVILSTLRSRVLDENLNLSLVSAGAQHHRSP
jgi:hypothetical protein